LYEIVWTRLLTLDLGHTVAAATAVLAAFMGGLAVGAALGGRLAADLGATQALRSYARIELAIGAYASAFPVLLFAARPMLAFAYGVDGGPWFAVLRVGLALALVSIPATFMGATYPLMIRAAGDEPHSTGPPGAAVRLGHHAAKPRRSASELDAREGGRVKPGAASLYTVNTFGAAAGALVTGFVLLPQLGMLRTTFVGVAMNVALAALAWRLSIVPLSVDSFPKTARHPATNSEPHEAARVSLAAPLIVVAVSGAAALTLEIAWTRTLAMIVGPTTYAFSAMLSSFILALAAGARG
jgi:spermidine synthase